MSTLNDNKKKKIAIRGLGAALVGFAGWAVLLVVFGRIDPNILKVNNILNLLRSMAKAKYSVEPIGHFGLVLEDYAHFTSPIRRYPDLAIHRILTDLCYNKQNIKYMQKRYAGFAKEAAQQSSEAEITAMRVERECDDCYLAEYMTKDIGEAFEGTVSSVQEFGFFVELDNTVEGCVRVTDMNDDY